MQLDLENLDSRIISLMNKYAPQEFAHGLRVSTIVDKIIKKCGLTFEFLDNIIKAAFLHDIGKPSTKIPHLYEDHKFIASERKLVEQHPHLGCQILQNNGFSEDICKITLCHHLWFNGEGYPQITNSKINNKIKNAVQIISVVDAFDAMLLSCYKPAQDIKKVLIELKEGINIQFWGQPILILEDCLYNDKSFFCKLYPSLS